MLFNERINIRLFFRDKLQFQVPFYGVVVYAKPPDLDNENYFSTGNVQDALVGNGHAMGVLPQVPDHLLSACQRRFAVDDPFGLISLLHAVIEQEKLVLLLQGSFEAVKKPTFKGFA